MATSWKFSIKVASVSAGVLLTAVMFKLLFPVLVEFLSYELPFLWSIAVSWLRPPYLYLLINCIILTIVLSSKLQPQKSDADVSAVEPQSVQNKTRESLRFDNLSPIKPVFNRIDAVPEGSPVVFGYVDDLSEAKASEVKPQEESVNGVETESEEFIISRSSWMPPLKGDPVVHYESAEKPLVSQRFANRKSVKASPEGGKARLGVVSKPKRHDALESTWRTITDGRPMPLTRHLKKCETLDLQGRCDNSPSGSPAAVMKKSETFNDRASSNNSSLSSSPAGCGSGRQRREPSLSHDELNRRVEAFIRKFNEDMRLQSQESFDQYRGMVSRRSR